VAAELGLPAGIPVAAGGGDNAAAAVGTGIVRAGLVSSSVGTSGVVFAHSDGFAPDPSGRVHAFCHAVPDRYHLMGVVLSAGGSLRWWRDVLGAERSYDDLAAEAAAVPPGAEGLLFLPYLTGERTPHLDPMARGAFFGLTARHGRAHMTRAVMEGVLYALRDSLDIMRGLDVAPSEVRATGGGARSRLWLELQADVYGIPVVRTAADEGPAYGAALLAGVAAGTFASVDDACARVTLAPEVVEPDPSRSAVYAGMHALYRELYPATAAIAHRL
jgi:xylulokinase